MKNTKYVSTSELKSEEKRIDALLIRLSKYPRIMRSQKADLANSLCCIKAELMRRGA